MGSVAISRIDGISTSTAVKSPVHAVATTNVVLSGLQTIGGVTLDGDLLYRVLLTGQTNPVENGIYDASTGSWTRSDDFDDSRDVVKGTMVVLPSSSPVVYYRVSAANPIVPGVTAITFISTSQLDTLRVDLTSTASSSLGTGLINWLRNATGAVVTSLYRWFDWQAVNIMEFMTAAQQDDAKSNAATLDCSAALQAALNVGKNVYIPYGTYLILTACQMKTTSQTIFGDGQLSVLLTTTNVETLYSSTSVFGIDIREINFKNTVSEAVTGPTQYHVHFGAAASGCNVIRCGFNTALTGAVVRTTHKGGVWFEGANLNNSLDCNYGLAQILMGSTDSTIRGGFIYSFAHEYAIKIVSAGEVVVDAVRGILGGQSQGCIWIPNASYMNKIVNNYFGGTTSTINIGKGVNATQQQLLQILNNTFHEMDDVAVDVIDPVSGCEIKGNSFWAGNPKQNQVLASVAITGVAGQFSCTATTLTLNSPIMISGTFGGTGSITGYVNPTTYYITVTNGTTTFTLSSTLGGSAITTTAGTPTGLTYTNGSIAGKQDILIESVAYGASDVIITGNICNRFIGPVESPPMPGLGYANAIEIKTFSGVTNNIVRNNAISGARYYSSPIVDGNGTNSIGDNAGAPFTYTWTPSDLSGAGLTFTSVNCKYIRDAESITFWGTLTFPVTANGSGVVIGGLPVSPAVGMEGAVGVLRTNSATGQKIKLNPGQQYFYITNTVDAQVANSACSTNYFSFSGRYLY